MTQAGTAGQTHFTVQLDLGGYRCVGAVSARSGSCLTEMNMISKMPEWASRSLYFLHALLGTFKNTVPIRNLACDYDELSISSYFKRHT